jgi:hypothetical protein
MNNEANEGYKTVFGAHPKLEYMFLLLSLN